MTSILRLSLLASLVVVTGTFPRLAGAADSKEEPTLHDRVYFFQHRLLPGWTNDSEGRFFAALVGGELSRMTEAAREIVGEDFASQLKVRVLSDTSGVLISFAAPQETPECYFGLVMKDGETFRYYTLEKTEDILELGMKSVVGQWTSDRRHLNLGSRTYTDEASFLADVVALMATGAKPQASMKAAGD